MEVLESHGVATESFLLRHFFYSLNPSLPLSFFVFYKYMRVYIDITNKLVAVVVALVVLL